MDDKENPDSKTDDATPLNSSTNKERPVSDPVDKVVAPIAGEETVEESDLFEVDIVDKDDGVSANGACSDKPPAKGQQSSEPKEMVTLDVEGTRRMTYVDEADGASLYSYYMESDFRYYFQHPYARLSMAYLVTVCNFLIYAEDPVAHSRTECNIPVIGNSFAFVCMRYPPNAWSLLKVVLWIAGIVVGLVAGKLLVHTLLFNRLFRLKMFSDDKGSWMTMFLTTILCLFISSAIYNLFLMIGGDSTEAYRISPYMNVPNHVFMKVAATGTWCGDFFTAWMVTDMMLQEKLYPMWAKKPRMWWNRRYNRIILFWLIVVISSFIVIFVIATDYIQWDSLNRDFLHTNELSRAFLASFILVMDILIVMQDWDFPHFIGAIDLKLPGVNTAHIHFKIPQVLKKLEYWHVHITGKWFNYGILFIVILLDLNMWKNQIFYAPPDYGQYVDTEGRIHSVNDEYSLTSFNQSQLSFEFRNTTVDPITGKRYIELDNIMNARYNGYSLGLKALAFVPCMGIFITFGVFVWLYGRMPKPTKEDPYGGRLKFRKKRRFSVRVGWKRLRRRFRLAPAVLSALKAFKKEGQGSHGRTGEGITDELDEQGVALKVVDVWKKTKKEDLEDSNNQSVPLSEVDGDNQNA